MKSLYESILGSTNAKLYRFTEKNVYVNSNVSKFDDVFDMNKMYKDAEKKYGLKPETQSNAIFMALYNKGLNYNDLKKLLNKNTQNGEQAEIADEMFKEALEDYILKTVKFKFTLTPTNVYKDSFLLACTVSEKSGSRTTTAIKHIGYLKFKDIK